MTSQSTRLLSKGLLARFTLLFFPFAGLFTAAIWPVLQSYEEGRISIIKASESGYLDVATRLIKSEFNRSMGDMQAITRDPLLQRYINEGIGLHRKDLEHLLTIHAEGYRRYDQIRLLDMKGQEVIRINYSDGKAHVVPMDKLQDKSQRYYFIEANKLAKGEIYVSPIDLNVEHGKVEVPHKPTIRFATPLFDSEGKRQGVLLLNYLGNILLQAFKSDMRIDPLHQAMLLNSDGYWISHPKPEKEWGFILDRSDKCFSSDFPIAWKHIRQTTRGEFNTDSGLMLFSTIHPLQDNLEGAPLTSAIKGEKHLQEYYWKIVIFLPRYSLSTTSFIRHGQGKLLLVAIYILIALSAFLVALFIVYSKQRREQRIKSAQELEDLYDNAPCGYHSLDANGLIVKMNQTELKWLGYEADELIGKKHYIELMEDVSKEKFREKFPEFLQQGYIHDVEFDITRKNGSILPIMVSATAVLDEQDKVVMSRSTVFDMTERKKLEQRLKQQATTDFLTGLNNRRNFYYLAEIELVRTQRNNKPLSVLLIDIDHFKNINDTYGHEAGDKALQTFSSICREELREIDILGRVGGEEFAALLPETDGQTALEVAKRLNKVISSSPLNVPDTVDLNMTTSIGITTHMETDRNIHDMLKRADRALYTAKKGGRNQVCYEDTDINNDTCDTS